MDLTNRDLIFCPAACRPQGLVSPLRLESTGFLSRLRAVSYACPACGHVTAVSLRSGAFATPSPGQCWNCNVAFEPGSRVCASCDADPDPRSTAASGIFFTYPAADLAELSDLPQDALAAMLAGSRAAGQLEESLRAADALTYRFGDQAWAWRDKGALYLERGYLPLALHATKRAVSLAPDDVSLWLEFSNVLDLLDEGDAAADAAHRAAALAPENPRPRATLASLLHKLDRFEEAAVEAQAAVNLDPTSADAWATLGTLAMRRKAYPEAIAAWNSVLATAPEFPLAWRYLGLCHFALKQWPEAAAAAGRAGDDDDALELAVEAHLNQGDSEAALAAAERAEAARPGQSRFLYLVARAHMARGAYPEGLATCDRILAIEPGAEWAKKARAMFAAKLDAAR